MTIMIIPQIDGRVQNFRIGQKMNSLKDEIAALSETPMPHDFTTDQITAWLEALKAALNDTAVHLLSA